VWVQPRHVGLCAAAGDSLGELVAIHRAAPLVHALITAWCGGRAGMASVGLPTCRGPGTTCALVHPGELSRQEGSNPTGGEALPGGLESGDAN